ncbi:MAG TPA: LysR family transcriptional regulator [Steroidobacteraceae bacterium]|nr:LysR family transcriptional regulator [Steroidobacteraceae bacterium]
MEKHPKSQPHLIRTEPPSSGEWHGLFMDIRKLQAFVAIAEESSFTRASQRLHLAQPWISAQLKELEELLDARLFERSKGKLIGLSATGRQLLPKAQRLLAMCKEVSDEMRSIRRRNSSKLDLGVDPATLYVPDRNRLIVEFLRSTPDVDMHIISSPPFELFDGLKSGRFDIILTLCPAPEEDWEVLPLYEYDLRSIVPRSKAADYPADEHGGLKNAEVMILQDTYHPAFFAWLKASLQSLDIRWKECPEMSFQALFRYASMLNVVTLSPDFSKEMPELGNDLLIRKIENPPVKVCWALMRLRLSHTEAAGRFWEMAKG